METFAEKLRKATWTHTVKNPYLSDPTHIGYFAVPKLAAEHTHTANGYRLIMYNQKRIELLESLKVFATKVNHNQMPKWLKLRIEEFKGSATCRCCDASIGAGELIIRTSGAPPIGIPNGYTHLLAHQIAPDPKLDVLINHLQELTINALEKAKKSVRSLDGHYILLNNGYSYYLPTKLVDQALELKDIRQTLSEKQAREVLAKQVLDL